MKQLLSSETTIQLSFLLLTLALFFVIYNLPKKAFSKLRSNSHANFQSTRHFLTRAQLLSRAKTTRHRAAAESLAKEVVAEADLALSLLPCDGSALILRALALDLLGQRSSALRSLDLALAPTAAKSLSKRERGDALVKRGELQLGVNRRRRVDSALLDLVEAVSLTRDNSKAFSLLGQCYEIKGMKDEACEAFREALKVQPGIIYPASHNYSNCLNSNYQQPGRTAAEAATHSGEATATCSRWATVPGRRHGSTRMLGCGAASVHRNRAGAHDPDCGSRGGSGEQGGIPRR